MSESTDRALLIVQEQSLVSRREQTALESAGYRVTLARSQQEAEATIGTIAPDGLALVAIGTGGDGNGVPLARDLAAAGHLPIVFLARNAAEAELTDTADFTSYGCFVAGSGAAALLATLDVAARLSDAHAAARSREYEYRSLFDNMRDAILVADTNRRIVDCNAAFTRLFGYQLSEIAGKLTRYVYDSDEDYQKMGSAIRQQVPGPYFVTTLRYRSRDGRAFLGETSVSHREDLEGRVTAFVGLIRDVTESVETRRALERSEAHLTTAQRIAHLGSWEFHLDERLVQASEQALRIYGLPTGPLSIPRVQSMVLDDDRPMMDAALENLIRGIAPYDVEFRIRRGSDGAVRHIHSSAEYDETSNRVIGTIQDITERKETEERIRKLLREKDYLLREVHHRIKNNMQIISTLLSLHAEAIRDTPAAEALLEAKGRVTSMQLIYDRLYRTGDYQRVDLRELIESLVSDFRDVYSVRADPPDAHVSGDSLYIGTDVSVPIGIIMNELFSNALKHAFPGTVRGTIQVSVQDDGNGRALLVIADDGVGLPDEMELRGRSGFGFELVEAEVAQIGGTLEIRRNGGTEFRIRFPISR
jgi:PAS domain S-box-containing protein